MKITYLGHSGFLVETKEHYLLFDYYIGKLPAFSSKKALTVLVSHAHHDHYHQEIFALQEAYRTGESHIAYVLSHDIPKKQAEAFVYGKNELLFVKAHAAYQPQHGKVAVETLRSTDKGVAFLVTLFEEGKTYCFYHAGDLNLWKWEGESKAYHNNMEANFRREMERIKGRHFDVAFVPLDPRQEHFAYGGMDIFLETVKADVVFPMHFWNRPEIVRVYLNARPKAENLVALQKEGSIYEFVI